MKCKFVVQRNFLVRTEETLDIDPKDFLHCANIEELVTELDDYIEDKCEHPNHLYRQSSEELTCNYYNQFWDENSNAFFVEWQKLKGLPAEL